MAGKPTVHILGGGVGGMTVAHQLSRPGWQNRYEDIVLYQRGWRLGGKGASGRNEDRGQRIEEHGLHIWLGFYDNAFRMMRECYEELARPPGAPMRTIEEAFMRSSTFVVMEHRPEGWLPWQARFPEDPGLPGDPGARLPSPWQYVLAALELSGRMLSGARGSPPSGPAPVTITPSTPPPPPGAAPPPAPPVQVGPASPPPPDALADFAGDLWEWLGDLVEETAEAVIGVALAFASALQVDPGTHHAGARDRLLALIDLAADLARKQLPAPDQLSDRRRREWYGADLLMAAVRGVLRHGLLTHPDGLDAIDDYDFADWLIHHGADPESARSGLVTTCVYDLQFAYEAGEPSRPACSAAAALRGLARMFFTYRGAIAWKMRAGMGDVVFAPLYEVLKARGVDFRFFHRVDALRLSADRRRVAKIEMTLQAKLASANPTARYDPLVDVKGLPCWPHQPKYSLLDPAYAAVPGDHFETIWPGTPDAGDASVTVGPQDIVVLAIPVGAHHLVCEDLLTASTAWNASAKRIGTIYTQAFQLWLTEDLTELGVPDPDTTTGGYLEPFDTWADMRQTLAAEDWPHGHEPQAVAYFCNAMPTPPGPSDPAATTTQDVANAAVKAAALHFLSDHMAELWPGAVHRYPTDFKWEKLAPQGSAGVGPAAFDTQFHRANVDPSERYVLPLPGTARYRLDPAHSGFDNLFLAGDWTICGINAGCVEAAVISGMLAANAIDGHPAKADIVGYDHW